MRKSRKIGGKENSGFTPATSRPSSRINFDEKLLKKLRLLSKAERKTLGETIDRVAQAFGHPHLHSGIGIRKLADDLFEYRSGLQTRLIFERLPEDILYFHLLGSHDEVLRFLRARR